MLEIYAIGATSLTILLGIILLHTAKQNNELNNKVDGLEGELELTYNRIDSINRSAVRNIETSKSRFEKRDDERARQILLMKKKYSGKIQDLLSEIEKMMVSGNSTPYSEMSSVEDKVGFFRRIVAVLNEVAVDLRDNCGVEYEVEEEECENQPLTFSRYSLHHNSFPVKVDKIKIITQL